MAVIDIRYVFRLENLLNIVESDKALINSCYDILSTPKVFDHLGQKSDHIHSGYKPEKEKYLNQKHHNVHSIHNEIIVYFLFSFDGVLEIVPDIDDDYDDDNSLAKSVLSLLCGAGPRNTS